MRIKPSGNHAMAAALLAGSLLLLSACTSPGPLQGDAWASQDETQIRASLDASVAAWNRGDLKGHLAIYDPSVTAMTKKGPRPTVEAIEESFSKAYFADGKPKQNLRMESVVVRGLSAQSALVTGRYVLSGGQQAEQSGWFTLVWVRTPAGWRAVHDHSS